MAPEISLPQSKQLASQNSSCFLFHCSQTSPNSNFTKQAYMPIHSELKKHEKKTVKFINLKFNLAFGK
jgi:hypothetical protein